MVVGPDKHHLLDLSGREAGELRRLPALIYNPVSEIVEHASSPSLTTTFKARSNGHDSS